MARPASQALGLAGLFALFLNAAGTFDAGFTLTPSYLLLGLSVAVGFPGVVRGWQRCRRRARWRDASSSASTSSGSCSDRIYNCRARRTIVLPRSRLPRGRRSRTRGHGPPERHRGGSGGLRRAATWVCAGGLIAAAYALYQWPAQQFDWPFADVNNALNSDGYTSGHRFQGEGILGWERVRGTFKEPLFLASYLAVVLCLSAGLAVREHRLLVRRLLIVTAGASLLALGLTASSLTWGALTLVVVATGVLAAVSFGRVRLAGALGATLAAALLIAPPLFADPATLSRLTGRSGTALQVTSDNRVRAWREASVVSPRSDRSSDIAPDKARAARLPARRRAGQRRPDRARISAGTVGLGID